MLVSFGVVEIKFISYLLVIILVCGATTIFFSFYPHPLVLLYIREILLASTVHADHVQCRSCCTICLFLYSPVFLSHFLFYSDFL